MLKQNFGLAEKAKAIRSQTQEALGLQEEGTLNIPKLLPIQELPGKVAIAQEPVVGTDIRNTAEYKLTALVLDDAQLSKVGNFEILRELEDPQLNKILDQMKGNTPSFIAATVKDKSPYTWHADRAAPPYNSEATFKDWLVGDLMSDKLYDLKPVRAVSYTHLTLPTKA